MGRGRGTGEHWGLGGGNGEGEWGGGGREEHPRTLHFPTLGDDRERSRQWSAPHPLTPGGHAVVARGWRGGGGGGDDRDRGGGGGERRMSGLQMQTFLKPFPQAVVQPSVCVLCQWGPSLFPVS